MKKLTPLFIFALMSAFAASQWWRLRDGGHAFTSTADQLTAWSASHILLMLLTLVCIVGATVATRTHAKILFWVAVAFLAAVQMVGAYVGLNSTAAASDHESAALIRKAEAMEREAAGIRATVLPQLQGLTESAVKRDGVAARSKMDYLRDELARAGSLETAAADLRSRAGVTSAAVGASLADLLLLAMTIATELGFGICSKLLALIYGDQIRRVFSGLGEAANSGK